MKKKLETVTKDEFVDLVHNIANVEYDLTKKEVRGLLDCVFEGIKHTLLQKKRVQLTGYLTIEPRYVAARNGINPQTKEAMAIPETVTVKAVVGDKIINEVKEKIEPEDLAD